MNESVFLFRGFPESDSDVYSIKVSGFQGHRKALLSILVIVRVKVFIDLC